MATMTSMAAVAAPQGKREGDISDSFASLDGTRNTTLPDRFRELKLSLVAGHEQAVIDSWNRLLAELKTENAKIAAEGIHVIPSIRFSHLDEDMTKLRDELHKRGVAVVRGVIPEKEARAYKFEIEDYVRKNPSTKGFPPEKPQVLELYWTAPQLKARSHPNFMAVQRKLMQLWNVEDPAARIDLSQPLSYADRLRIRLPGDARFALGPHQDGGGVERWERDGYGKGHVYDAVFEGHWEDYDPWEAGKRIDISSDLYQGLGACSVFRAFQGWMSISHSGPGLGTLLVNPLAKLATVYTLLRPFFRPIAPLPAKPSEADVQQFLSPENWTFTAGAGMTSDLQGATPGHGQEFPEGDHPHLELDRTMIHIPPVKPGDLVVWHCDTIHAVDRIHKGTEDSSVMYIPVVPLTDVNAEYLVRQRAAFLAGTPGLDFPGGKGESGFVDRATADDIYGDDGKRAMGLAKLETKGLKDGALAVTESANAALGF